MQRERLKLDSLTSLRFFAAAMVVTYHTLGILWWPSDALDPFLLNQGVSFFFVLSGFVLHLTYRDAIETRELGYGDFIVRRWFRLWPAHVAALALAVALNHDAGFRGLIDYFTFAELFQIVFMLHALNPDSAVYYAINPPAWSISTEFLFYLATPLTIGLTLRRPLATLSGSAVLLAGYLVFAASIELDEDQLTGLLYISPLSRIVEFVLGTCTCELWLRSRDSGTTSNATFLEATALVAVVAAMSFTESAAGLAGAVFGGTLARYVEVAFPAPMFALLIFVFASQRGRVSALLSRRGLVRLGEISFAVYLVHLTLLHVVADLGWFLRLPVFAQIAGFAFVTLGVAWILYRSVETWGIRLGRQLAARLR